MTIRFNTLNVLFFLFCFLKEDVTLVLLLSRIVRREHFAATKGCDAS